MLRLVRGLLVGYLLWCGTLFIMQSSMLYLPGMAGAGLSEAELAGMSGVERLWIDQADGTRTEAWLLRSQDPQPARGLVCFTHGNAERIDDCLSEAHRWQSRGFDVLLPEYRGYGRTRGTPSQAAIVADVERAIEQALERTGAPALLLHGRSLGTGIAAQVARNQGATLRALILESPFTSIAGFAPRYGIPSFLVTDPYRTDEILPDLDCPILILHASRDEVVPFEHGATLASLTPLAQLVPLAGSHNSGLSQTTAYWEAVDALLARLEDAAALPVR